ncbi:hypothetical protein ZIOFF_039456 [Zingiber officinale]|uniref:Uncharacterized protein n=1 Tax=Zingiber officinale TaxID=94328 RepID=A0A8J5G4U3_ZINOF|nr:hypothetical protein ZIOFF_039456 [Zingiber officinale]
MKIQRRTRMAYCWMKEIQECPPESQKTTNITDDAISIVFDKETRGRVRGLGFGVTPSKVGAFVQQNQTVKQLQAMVHNLQQEMQEMKYMFLQSMRQHNQQEQVGSGGIGRVVLGTKLVAIVISMMLKKKIGDFYNVNKHLATAQSNLKNVSRGDIRANTKCKLLHWCVDGLFAAEGRITSTDPNTKVHHVVLGGSCWKILSVVLEFWKSFSHVQILELYEIFILWLQFMYVTRAIREA